MDNPATGNQLNRMIKNGAIKASEVARTSLGVEEFHQKLIVARGNVTAIRDNTFPECLVLDIGVAILTECYREPFQQLLDESCLFLKDEISKVLRETLNMFPKFEELVQTVASEEIDLNKDKAEEYLNVQIGMHKRL